MPTSDEQAIFDETAAFSEAWNRGDAGAAAAYFTEDGVRVGAFGDAQAGLTAPQHQARRQRSAHRFRQRGADPGRGPRAQRVAMAHAQHLGIQFCQAPERGLVLFRVQ